MMGISISLLSAGTVSFVGAVCFAAGYLLSAHSFRSVDRDDDGDNKEDHKKRSIKGAQRIFRLFQDMVRVKAGDKRKTDAMTVVDQKSKNKKHTPLEIESLAEILEDFKMVESISNFLLFFGGLVVSGLIPFPFAILAYQLIFSPHLPLKRGLFQPKQMF